MLRPTKREKKKCTKELKEPGENSEFREYPPLCLYFLLHTTYSLFLFLFVGKEFKKKTGVEPRKAKHE